MVPLKEYATVNDDASLYEALIIMDNNQNKLDYKTSQHQSVLVMDKKNKVIGKLTYLDVLKALEPKYKEMLKGDVWHFYGFTKKFMQSILRDHYLFQSPIKDICQKAGEQNVKKFMYTPSEGEYIQASATMDQAINQFILGQYQSLMVAEKLDVIGVLRLADVYAAIFNIMKECHIK
jgi:predicted transcriptional regulator